MLVVTFRIQPKKWNLHLTNFSSQWPFQYNFVHRNPSFTRSRSTYINPGAPGIAQKARDAASSIRKAIVAQDTLQAKETTYSMLDYTTKTRWCSNPGRHFPSRLVAHSLIHALLREGKVVDAGYEMKEIMSLGVTFHHRTIQKNISLLCSMPFIASEDQVAGPNDLTNHVYPGDSESGFLLSALHTRLPPPTRLATSLLIAGRRYRQKRTEEMFNKLIDACLLQGEIIIATLLFVLLVKDWQFRSVVRASGTRDELLGYDTETQEQFSGSGFPTPSFAKTIALHRLQIPYPEVIMIQKILDNIKYHMIFTNTPTEAHLASIESLALLANLVEEGSLPYGNISSLLRAMQDCPRGALFHLITIRHRRRVQSLPIYWYIHNVLTDLCNDLPSKRPKKANLVSPRMLSPLDLRSYNTLLHYTLRHRFSPAMANQIFDHMLSHRNPPLKPDITTYNILLRSASLLGRNDLAYAVLAKLRETSQSSIDSSVHLPELRSAEKQSRRSIPRRIVMEMLSIPPPDRAASVTADNYTLSSYISHLISTSQLDAMIQTLIELLPILEVSPSQWHRHAIEFQESLKRAILYGPHVLAAFLNGCQKSGKSSLTERLWLLAKEAEFASWQPQADPQTYSPWCLSIEAYTSVMQCYASESKKGLSGIRGHRYLTLLSEYQHKDLVRKNRDKQVAKGWGHYIMELQGQSLPPDSSRHETSKTVGWHLCNSMLNVASNVSRVLDQLKAQMQDIPLESLAQLEYMKLPIPDARFCNALLDIFGRRPGMQYRRVSSGRSRWKRKLRIGFDRFWHDRAEVSTYDPRLVEIATILASYGYALPLGFRRVLIGRPTPVVRREITRKRDVVPLSTPHAQISSKSFTIAVVNTRGLTFSRRCKRLRRRRLQYCKSKDVL